METEGASETSHLDLIVQHSGTASVILYSVIFVVGTVGNALVIYVTGFRMKRTVNSVWFLNLALADFLFTAFLIFSIIAVARDHQWNFGEPLCKLNTFVNTVNMFASIFLLMAISLDRCLATWVVVWAQNKRTVRKAQVITVVIWIAATVCSTPYATFRKIEHDDDRMYCVYAADEKQQWALAIFRFIMGFLLPFLVISISYVAISVRAGRLQKTRKRRCRRVIISIILAFFFCWLPFHIFQFIELQSTDEEEKMKIITIGGKLVVSLAFMNSCLNPILYVFMCEEFQKKLKQSLCLVLESALAEDHVSFMSSRSLSSHFSRISRKSDSSAPIDTKITEGPLNYTESVVMTDDR